MPVGSDRLAATKQQVIENVAQTYGLAAHLPNYNLIEYAFNIKAALEDLKASLFVVADLSLERPSCYYELGIAEALGKKVYIIAQTGTVIHQTVNRKDTQFYNDTTQLKIIVDKIFSGFFLA